jgi:hypothetical protein
MALANFLTQFSYNINKAFATGLPLVTSKEQIRKQSKGNSNSPQSPINVEHNSFQLR